MPTSSARAPLRPVDLLVLAVLQPEPLHGYGIVQAIETLTDGRVALRPGDVYRVLYRMHRDGLLEPDIGSGEPDAERRAYYRITERGCRIAAAEAELLAEVSARILDGARATPRGRS